MHETEGINFKVGVPGEGEKPQRKIPKQGGLRHNNPNLEDIIAFIGGLPLPESDRDSLLKSARSVPHGALSNFRKNYMKYLNKERRP